jgi:hypothetical protein
MDDRQPRSTGELLSDALSLFRRHFKLLYSLALPFCALDLIIREAGQSALQSMRSKLEQDPGNLDVEAVLALLAAGAGGIGLILASAVLVQVLASGLVTLTSQAWHQRAPALADAINAVVSRAAPLVATSLLFFLAIFGLMGVLMVLVGVSAATGSIPLIIIMSLVALAGMVLALVFLTLRWGVYTQAVVLENRFGPGAFARSTELMAGRGLPFFESAKLRLSLLFLITFAIGGTLQSLFAVPRLIVAFATGWDVADGMPPLASMPLWFIVPFGLMEVLTNALVVPFSSVLMTLFYFDLRVRFEGYDLTSAAPSIASEAAHVPDATDTPGGPPA